MKSGLSSTALHLALPIPLTALLILYHDWSCQKSGERCWSYTCGLPGAELTFTLTLPYRKAFLSSSSFPNPQPKQIKPYVSEHWPQTMGGLKTGNICISVQCLHSLHSLTVIVKWDSKQQFLLGVDAPLYTPMTFCSHMTGNDTGWQVWSSFQASGDFFL